MRVINEFVDIRNGKRYFRGQGNLINPPLAKDQVERLKKANCLEEGEEESPKRGSVAKADYSKLTVAQLKETAAGRKIDLGEATTKAAIIEVLESADMADA